MSYALELILGLLYTLNRSFLPAPKWRFYYIGQLAWLPKICADALRDAMLIREISTKDAQRRARNLAPVWHEILNRFHDGFRMDSEVAKRLYLETILHLPLE